MFASRAPGATRARLLRGSVLPPWHPREQLQPLRTTGRDPPGRRPDEPATPRSQRLTELPRPAIQAAVASFAVRSQVRYCSQLGCEPVSLRVDRAPQARQLEPVFGLRPL